MAFYFITCLCLFIFPAFSSASSSFLELPIFANSHDLNSSHITLLINATYFNSSLLLSSTIFSNVYETNYFVEVKVGSSNIPMKLTLDTGGRTTWVAGVESCVNRQCNGFNKASSKTIYSVPCNWAECKLFLSTKDDDCTEKNPYLCHTLLTYGDSMVKIQVIKDTLTFGKVSARFVFGYGYHQEGRFIRDGILGLGRTERSIVEQAYFSKGKFSLCLPRKNSGSSSKLIFNDPSFPHEYNIMPFYTNPSLPHLYYIPILKISIENEFLPIPSDDFRLKDNGKDGFTIDSGCTYTRLMDRIAEKFIPAFIEQISPPPREVYGIVGMPGLSCFAFSSEDDVYYPEVAIYFPHYGYTLRLPQNNTVIHVEEHTCLAFVATPETHNTLGNHQLQTFRFGFDVDAELFGVKPTPQC